jgi:hypothetical protein
MDIQLVFQFKKIEIIILQYYLFVVVIFQIWTFV